MPIPSKQDLERLGENLAAIEQIISGIVAEDVTTPAGTVHKNLTDRLRNLQDQLDLKDAEGQAALDVAKSRLTRYAAINYKGDHVPGASYEANDVWKNPSDDTYWITPSDYTAGASAQADIDSGNVRPHQNLNMISAVDTIDDLRAIPPAYYGQKVSVSGYYEPGIGGGEFYWKAGDYSAEISSDDKGQYIASDHDSSGSAGCWVLDHKGSMTLDQWGCYGDYSNTDNSGHDDSIAFNKALLSGVKLSGRKGANYLITSASPVYDTTIDFDLNGSTIWQRGDFTPIVAHAQFSFTQAVSQISSGSVTLTGDGVGSATATHVLTVADSTGYTKNAFVKVYSDDLIDATDPEHMERRGEFAKVAAVSGNDIYLYSYLRDDYTTNVRIALMNTDVEFSVRNGKLNSASSSVPEDSQPLITCIGYLDPFTAVKSDYCCSELVEFVSCKSPRSYGMSAKEQRTSIVNYSYGYTVVEYSCEGGCHVEPKGYDCRHVYTTGTLSTELNDARPERYGRTRDFRVVGGYGSNCQNSAFDTHPDSYGGVFDSCVAVAPYNGPNGTQRNYQLRGQGAKIINCASVGGTGYHIYGSYEHPDSARGNEVINSSHEGLPVYQVARYAVSVIGQPGFPVLDTKVKWLKSKLKTGAAPFIYAEHARVEVIEVDSKGIYTTDYTWPVHAGDDAQIVFKRGTIDVRGSTAAGVRFAGVRSHTGDIRFIDTELLSDDAEIELARMNPETNVDGNGTFIATGIKSNNPIREYTSSLGVTYIGSTAKVMVSFESDNSASSVFSRTFTAGGDKSIGLNLRADMQLTCVLATTSGTPNISELDAGVRAGQRLTLSVNSSSAGVFTLLSTCTNVQLNSDVVIPVAGSISLVWTGSVWLIA